MILEPEKSENNITSFNLFQEEEKFLYVNRNAGKNKMYFKPSYSPKIIKRNLNNSNSNADSLLEIDLNKYKRHKRLFSECNKYTVDSELLCDKISQMNIGKKKFKFNSGMNGDVSGNNIETIINSSLKTINYAQNKTENENVDM